MSYMKWASDMKAIAKAAHDSGMLGVLAATTSIPEYRLRDWVTKNTIDILSYIELRAIEDWAHDREILQAKSSESITTSEHTSSGRFTASDAINEFDNSD